MRLFEGIDPLPVALRDLGEGGLTRDLLLLPRHQWIPERRAPHRKADEPRHANGDGSLEAVVDHRLGSSDLRRLLRAQGALPAEHTRLKGRTMVKGQYMAIY